MRRVTEADIERDLTLSSGTRYVPDLQSLLQTCEMNYLQLKQLIPQFNKGDVYQWLIDRADQEAKVTIEVSACSRYTVDLSIRQQLTLTLDVLPKALNWTVRLYLDTKMAEVFTFQCAYARLGVHEYPNNAMLQRDEKAQANRFLKEWLGHCVGQGRASVSFSKLLDTNNPPEGSDLS